MKKIELEILKFRDNERERRRKQVVVHRLDARGLSSEVANKLGFVDLPDDQSVEVHEQCGNAQTYNKKLTCEMFDWRR